MIEDNLQEEIANILRQHRFIPSDRADACQGCEWEGVLLDGHEAHIAEVLIDELQLNWYYPAITGRRT